MRPPFTQALLLLSALLLATSSAACKRKPQDLDVWKPSVAKNGQEKLVEWIHSPDELFETRVRATEILLEENLAYAANQALEKASPEDRTRIIDALAPTVDQWCKANDASLENYNANTAKQPTGKDAAFQLYPFAQGDAKAKFKDCILSWIDNGDYHVRDQMGNAKILQMAEALGPDATPALLKALKADPRNKPGDIARHLYAIKDPNTDKLTAEALVEIARARLPNIPPDIANALLETNHDAVVPFFTEIVPNEAVDGAFRTTAVDRIKIIKGKAALPIFLEWVEKHPGNLRWLAAQAIAESQGKAGLAPLMSKLPDNDKYGDGDPEGFKIEAQRFCLVEIKGDPNDKENPPMEGARPIFLSQLKRGSAPARALALRCLQEVGTPDDKPAIEPLLDSKEPIPAWGDTKTLGDLAKETLSKL
jgi:HEAT repeat protein